jgi:hypothetical protein
MIMLGFHVSIVEINVADPQMGSPDAVLGPQPLDPTRNHPAKLLAFNLTPAWIRRLSRRQVSFLCGNDGDASRSR